MEIPNQYIRNIYRVLVVFLVILSVFFAIKLPGEFNALRAGDGFSSITLSGHGEVSAVPDIATVYFTVSKEAKTNKDALDGAAVIEKKALEFLKTKGVEDKDIKASNISSYPKYTYVRGVCPQMEIAGGATVSYDCGSGKQVLTGYEASENITVKVRNVDDAGAIIQGLGGVGVSNVNGPNFAIDEEDALKAEARKKAIDDAQAKAKILAKDLGVRLGKVTSFYDSSDGYGPMMYAESAVSKDSRSVVSSAPAQLPKGENTITSDVTITYEIR